MRKNQVVSFFILSALLVLSGCFSKPEEEASSQPKLEAHQPNQENTPQVNETEKEKQPDKKNPVEKQVTESVTSPNPKTVEAPKTAPAKKESNNQVTQQSLHSRYVSELESLENHYKEQLQGIYQQAITEVKASPGVKREVLNKFTRQAVSLQEESQAKVNQILYQYKNELKQLNRPIEVIDQLRNAYYTEIDKEKSRLASMIKKTLNLS